jgi:hypothetical protein
MGNELPQQSRSFRLTDEDLELLRRLSGQLARSQRDIVSMALIHLAETLRRDERVHLQTPKEAEER